MPGIDLGAGTQAWGDVVVPLRSSHSCWINVLTPTSSVLHGAYLGGQDEFWGRRSKQRFPEELTFEGWAGIFKLEKA